MTRTMSQDITREQLSLDQGWRFHLGDIPMSVLKTHDDTYHSAKAGKAWGAAAPEYNAADWRQLDLPHDWAVEGPFVASENEDQGFRPHSRLGYLSPVRFAAQLRPSPPSVGLRPPCIGDGQNQNRKVASTPSSD